MTEDPIVLVRWKDEGDFGFISCYRQSEVNAELEPTFVGVPYDPFRKQEYGTLAEAQALADEHNASLEVT